ncbi:unnamed protein product [Mytilus coruscus]|uniref:Uncharacterized protein n=1 Tax=Mytilus coruscus TaxID=42192 RepID=A0A6J8A5T8_MYTCO|nr:unnamed protein product [Mytilus coruscus]
MNDKSMNDTKYCEELDEETHESILTIRDFSVDDVNIPYECVYGFWKYRATLVLKEDEFEFHPEEQLPVKPAVNGYNISLNVTFQLVYPVPVCTAMIGVKNISSELIVSSTTTHLLYMSTIVLDYMTSPNECTQSLVVTCLVGRTVLKVADFTPCTSQDAPSMLFFIDIVVAVCAVVFILVLLTLCWYARRKRKGKNIGENDKRENVPFQSRQEED